MRRNNQFFLLCGLCIVSLLQGCSIGRDSRPNREVSRDTPDAVVKNEPRSRSGNPASYEVFGKRYFVLPTAEGYDETAIDSWYGSKFHGRRTSSGETYDMFAMTAAHKTLPLPTYVEVTHLGTGKRIVVKVNDRGPFVEGRIIDLSFAAARKLGIDQVGTARVRVRALSVNTGNNSESIAAPTSSQSPVIIKPPINNVPAIIPSV